MRTSVDTYIHTSFVHHSTHVYMVHEYVHTRTEFFLHADTTANSSLSIYKRGGIRVGLEMRFRCVPAFMRHDATQGLGFRLSTRSEHGFSQDLNPLPTTQAEARDERRRAAVVEEAAQRARQEGEGSVLGKNRQKSIFSDFIESTESTLTRAIREKKRDR